MNNYKYNITLGIVHCKVHWKNKYTFHAYKIKRWLVLPSYKVLYEAETGLLQNGKDSTFLYNDTLPTIIKEKNSYFNGGNTNESNWFT